VPDAHFKLNSALLAYGPGRKSDEALFVAAYLAASWKIPLTVVSAQKEGQQLPSPAPLERARTYLEAHEVEARYVLEEVPDPALAVLLNAEIHNAGFIITGRYEHERLKTLDLLNNLQIKYTKLIMMPDEWIDSVADFKVKVVQEEAVHMMIDDTEETCWAIEQRTPTLAAHMLPIPELPEAHAAKIKLEERKADTST
jgi:hypothetical protein